MASPASSSIPPHSTTNVGPLNTAGTGGCAPLGAVPPGGAPGGAPGGNPMYMLQWHEHHASFFRLMEDLCREQSLTDVTITCGDVSLEAHSLILGASSPILRSILAKGEGKKQTLHFMDMNPYHMQLLLQYMYRGEISVPQIELAPLMASARSLQVKGLCSAGPGGTGSNPASGLNIIDPPAISLPPPTPILHTQATHPTVPTDRLSEFANYLAANTQPQPITSSNLIMPPGDLQPLDASGLINLEPPQQPVIMVNNTVASAGSNKKKRSSGSTAAASNSGALNKAAPNGGQNGALNTAASTGNNENKPASASKKRRTKKPFEELRRPVSQHNHSGNEGHQPQNGDQGQHQAPDSSGSIKHLAMEVHDANADDLEDHVNGNGVGGIAENWSDQQTIKVKGHRIPVLPKPLSQMKTTETRSYLSRLIWATNGWKRPQYGNPETKPVWWPNELLNWAEMKKMGGKKADGLSNVNYNEIQKTILQEGYKYFGFDPETLCHIKTGSDMDTGTGNGPIGNSQLDHLLSPAAGLRTPLPASALMGQPITLLKSEDGFGIIRSSPPLPPSVAALAAAAPASSAN